MKARSLSCFFGVCASTWLLGQVAIDPVWIRSFTSTSHVTGLAFDVGADRLHLSYQPASPDLLTHIRAFNIDGTDIPDPYTELSLGAYWLLRSGGTQRLLAHSDTLYFLDHHEEAIDNMYWTRSARITLDSVTTFSMHTGSGAQVDMFHDGAGDIVVSPTVIRNYSKHHWLLGRAAVPTTDRIAADTLRIYCGRVPSIAVVDRAQMAMLPSLVVPSSGTSTRTLLLLNNDVIHYASVNSNLTMDIGVVDTSGASIWSVALSLPQTTKLSGITVDASGNTWVAGSQTTSPQTGVLLRFSPSGAQTGNYSFGRTINEVVTSANQVFISGWDALQSNMVYLAAFALDITTSVPVDGAVRMSVSPNPTNDLLGIRSIPQGAERLLVMDATGRTLKTLSGPFGTTFNFSVADLAPGSYFVRIDGGAGSSILPFQVSR